jgi:hypothetical protein
MRASVTALPATFWLAIFLISSLVFESQAGFAVDRPPKQDAAPVLSRAAELVDLQSPGGTPFLLLANVTLREGSKSVQGAFAMAWAAPGRYRRVFRFPGFTATEVVTEGAIYHQRSTEAMPLMIWELDQLLAFTSNYRLGSEWKVLGVQSEQSGGTELNCVRAQTGLADSKICVNATTGEPFSIDTGPDAFRMERMREHSGVNEHSEFADYKPFGGRTFPRNLTFRGWDARMIEVQVEKLIQVKEFATGEFTPPQGATKTGFCEAPETSGEVTPNAGPNRIPVNFTDMEVDMYFQVSSVGGVRYAQVVYSSNPLKNNEILHWFIGTHFPIKSCSGTPVAYEKLVRLKTAH